MLQFSGTNVRCAVSCICVEVTERYLPTSSLMSSALYFVINVFRFAYQLVKGEVGGYV